MHDAAFAPTLIGHRLTLRPFEPSQIHSRYLAWLNDPMVNAYSQRRDSPPIGKADARRFLESLRADEVVLAIDYGRLGHVGNVKYGPIDWVNRCADISILIGERSVWGKGVGAESVYLVTRYLFEQLALNRVDAGTRNPAFLRLVEKLDWKIEGVRRRGIFTSDGYRDQVLVGQLATEFTRRPEYEAAEEILP